MDRSSGSGRGIGACEGLIGVVRDAFTQVPQREEMIEQLFERAGISSRPQWQF
jgi:hypothetical protein